MRIVDAKVNICSPGRNFVTLKLITEDGVSNGGIRNHLIGDRLNSVLPEASPVRVEGDAVDRPSPIYSGKVRQQLELRQAREDRVIVVGVRMKRRLELHDLGSPRQEADLDLAPNFALIIVRARTDARSARSLTTLVACRTIR